MERFLGVDPLAAGTFFLSSYMGMENNPVSNVDPLRLRSGNYLDCRNVDGVIYNFEEEHMSKISKSFGQSMGWFERATLTFHEIASWAFRAAAAQAREDEANKIEGENPKTSQGGVAIGGGKIVKNEGYPQSEGGDHSRSYKLVSCHV